ncbi:hypothetical protein [Arthrobacter humicola]|uniref:hypothetical protein n=1 Tax=Arthrobacter humicola TaxID=409291 RepID=UPI001FAE1ED4|nr:hypothetical protein [Arthrobacter humicola]MCI9870518.1 hypothetical protein [Arthrobacter humicola]
MTQRRSGRRPAAKPKGTIEPFTRRTVELALKTQADDAIEYVNWLRQEHPGHSQADLVRKLETKFWKDARQIGRESGAAGTPRNTIGADSTGTETLEAAVFFVLAVAEANSSPHSELRYREELVRSVLLAKGTDKAIQALASRTAPHWAGKVVAKIPEAAYKPINNVMGPDFIVKSGQSGVIVIDEVAERGVGAGIGLATNTAFAWWVIRASRRAFKRPDSAVADLGVVIIEEDVIDPDEVVEGKAGPGRG